MAAAAAAVALDQQAVVNAFMRADALGPTEAIFFEPKGSIQRSFFRSYIKAGIFKSAGARWYLDVPIYDEYKRKQRLKVVIVAGVLAAVAGIAAIL